MIDEKVDENNIEEIADSFENTMKKGFLSGLILLVLQNESCHGYKILKEIEERTLGFFHPTSSTLYPLLDSLNNKKLIKVTKLEDSGRHKKIYKITAKGQRTLKMILQKHQKMIDSIKSIVFSTLGITDESEPIFLEYLDTIISTPAMNLVSAESTESKIKVLKDYRKLLDQESRIINDKVKEIDDLLIKLAGTTDQTEINEILSHQS